MYYVYYVSCECKTVYIMVMYILGFWQVRGTGRLTPWEYIHIITLFVGQILRQVHILRVTLKARLSFFKIRFSDFASKAIVPIDRISFRFICQFQKQSHTAQSKSLRLCIRTNGISRLTYSRRSAQERNLLYVILTFSCICSCVKSSDFLPTVVFVQEISPRLVYSISERHWYQVFFRVGSCLSVTPMPNSVICIIALIEVTI